MKKLIKLSDQIIIDEGELPLVTIFNWAFNHKDYIRESIDSILMQKTNFKVEIIIHDDSSTDGTKEIITEYQQKYPHLFNNILQVENQWSQGKSVMDPLFEKAKGKYIALTHGDDYWTDPCKLQKQVDFLENNKEFSICFTDYLVYDESGKKINYPELKNKYKNKSVFSRNNIIFSNFIPTVTVMFKTRKEVFSKLDPNLYPGDWFLHILNSEYGKIKFLPFESAVYRKHDEGVCSATSPIINNQKYLKSIKIFRKVYSKNYKVQFLFNIVVIKIRLQNIKFKLLGK
jgi:glycosyltransferase involved in cell wall biosynthesis